MEYSQQTIRKLIAFAVAVGLLAGLPHFLFDRKQETVKVWERSYEYLLPAEIGGFHVVNRWTNVQSHSVIEQGAIYQDSSGRKTAQFDIMVNASGSHNGLACYLARGMTLRERRIEQIQAADSSATFDVGFVGDQSIGGTGHSTLLIASTECGSKGCWRTPDSSESAQIIWFQHPKATSDHTPHSTFVPISITFQSLNSDGKAQDRESALLEFRELVSNFRLVPLQEIPSAN